VLTSPRMKAMCQYPAVIRRATFAVLAAAALVTAVSCTSRRAAGRERPGAERND
jgi:hypothetical protein